MKRPGYIAVLLFLIGMVAIPMIFTNSHDPAQAAAERPGGAMTLSRVPEFPSSVTWAGEKIDLDRYDMYERYDRELTSFCYLHSTTLLAIKRANRYFPVIEAVLKAYGMPADFKYLAAVESFMNPRALSPAKAGGLWQMLPATGKEYGLEVNEFVDERYHPAKATEAAIAYLKEAYGKYGNWTTAAASYNAGMRRITGELEKQLAGNAFDLFLNEETSRYIFRILALKAVMENPQQYGFILKRDQLYPVIRTRTVEVSTPIEDLALFAKENGITYAQLKEFNPWLRSRKLPNKTGKSYNIEIPIKEDLYYTTNKNKVYNENWVVD